MKTALVIVMAAALTGCGADIATTASTSAAVKKQEMEAAQQTKELAQKKIDQATQAIQQSAEQAGNVDK
jgi:hypothetical protein